MPERHPIRRRNPVARSPLLRKGGVHQRSRSGERQAQRNDTDALMDEYLMEREEESGEALDNR